jgi:hypothetical protein
MDETDLFMAVVILARLLAPPSREKKNKEKANTGI